jgi:hypothetical protein
VTLPSWNADTINISKVLRIKKLDKGYLTKNENKPVKTFAQNTIKD